MLNWSLAIAQPIIQESVPIHWQKLTLPTASREIGYDPTQCVRHFDILSLRYGPYTAIWPPQPSDPISERFTRLLPTVGAREGQGSNTLLMPPLERLDRVVADLVQASVEVTLIAPWWQHAPWFA